MGGEGGSVSSVASQLSILLPSSWISSMLPLASWVVSTVSGDKRTGLSLALEVELVQVAVLALLVLMVVAVLVVLAVLALMAVLVVLVLGAGWVVLTATSTASVAAVIASVATRPSDCLSEASLEEAVCGRGVPAGAGTGCGTSRA
mmetsp:Transcript_81766/g.162768  ORF Transcript_81766/g.162768 Transcript_81766/m.162768 type:complete len:146 (+) Transcript_81766:963-1400(+)